MLRTAVENLEGAAIPASVLEAQVLPARVADYRPEMLDELTSSGAVLWVGREPIGPSDGRVSLYRADHVALLLPSPARTRPDGELQAKIREHLTARGACFFPQIQAATGGFFRETLEALWDLVWAGEATNDTLRPLRALVRARRQHRPRPGDVPPEASGRWSLVRSYVTRGASPEEREAALAQSLLDRYGVVVREAVHAEGVPGGWAALYPVLRAMEEGGFGDAWLHPCDVSRDEDIEQFFAAARNRFGSIDFLVLSLAIANKDYLQIGRVVSTPREVATRGVTGVDA